MEDTGKTYIDDMLGLTDVPAKRSDPALSEIVQFFTGSNVLVTGGSGFLGKLLVEKLLRCCPDIGMLVMLMRPKKGKSPEERFKEHFDDPVYERLKKERPNFHRKIIMMEGDVEQYNLGLSEESIKFLRNTHVVIHGAATVRFDEKIRTATNTNVRGTREALLLAKQMPNIKAFVYVSTAFSHCVRKFIEEKHYKPPIDPDKLITLVEMLDDEQLEKLRLSLLGTWPNTYALTKAVAEDVVRKYSVGIPSCIVRPSIVVSTSKDPLTGWINNLYGPTGVVVGAAVGLIRSLHCNREKIADMIPADYVISNIVAAAWDTGNNGKTRASVAPSDPDSEISDNERVPIYNAVSSCQRPICWGEYMKQNEINGLDIPSVKILWYYSFVLNRYYFVHQISIIFLHYLPAVIVDSLAFITGRQPILLSAYKKIHKFSAVISYFSTQEWRFKNDHVLKLWDKLNPVDREMFNFYVGNLDWIQYFYHYTRGLRLYLLKDRIDTLDTGRKKLKKLKISHYTVVGIACGLLAWAALSFILFLWSLCPWAN